MLLLDVTGVKIAILASDALGLKSNATEQGLIAINEDLIHSVQRYK